MCVRPDPQESATEGWAMSRGASPHPELPGKPGLLLGPALSCSTNLLCLRFLSLPLPPFSLSPTPAFSKINKDSQLPALLSSTHTLPLSICFPVMQKEKLSSSCVRPAFLLCSLSSLSWDLGHVFLNYLFFISFLTF